MTLTTLTCWFAVAALILAGVSAFGQTSPSQAKRVENKKETYSQDKPGALPNVLTAPTGTPAPTKTSALRPIGQPKEQAKPNRSPENGGYLHRAFQPEVLPNWLLMIGSFGTLGFAWKTLRTLIIQTAATKMAADAAKSSADLTNATLQLTHRPKIIVRNIVIDGLLSLTNLDTPPAKLPSVLHGSYVVVNVGGLPATIRRRGEGALVESRLPMERPDLGNHARSESIHLVAGESREIAFDPVHLPDDDVIAVFRREATAYFLAHLEYTDAAGVIRQTGVCRKFDSEAKTFTRVENPDYEYAD